VPFYFESVDNSGRVEQLRGIGLMIPVPESIRDAVWQSTAQALSWMRIFWENQNRVFPMISGFSRVGVPHSNFFLIIF
jgi:hypothetical protein